MPKKKKQGSKAKGKGPQAQKDTGYLGDNQHDNNGGDEQNDETIDQLNQQSEETVDHLEIPRANKDTTRDDKDGGLDSKDATDQESFNDEKQEEPEDLEDALPKDEAQGQLKLDDTEEVNCQMRIEDKASNEHVETAEIDTNSDDKDNEPENGEVLKETPNNNQQENGETNDKKDQKEVIEDASRNEAPKEGKQENEKSSPSQDQEEVKEPQTNEANETKDNDDCSEDKKDTNNLTKPSNDIDSSKDIDDASTTVITKDETRSEVEAKTEPVQEIEEQVEPPKVNKEPTELMNSSQGPFSIHDVITSIPYHNPDIPGSEDSFPTYVEKLNDHIYVGTSSGELLHFFKIDEDYILVSRSSFHTKRVRPITKILLLPNIDKALVLSGGLLSCFLLPEFSPANIGRIKDVNDICLDHDNIAKNDATGVHVTVFSNHQIRIINVTPKALRLVKDVSYADSQKALRRSDYSLVASSTNYDLVDLKNIQKIPLFPILTVQDESATLSQDNMLKPLILPVGREEFFLTCGISQNEPSMGLVVNINGDISRGTVPLPKYPKTVGIIDPYILSTYDDGYLVINSLHDQSEVQRLEFSNEVSITNVSTSFSESHPGLIDLVKQILLIGNSDDETKEKEAKEFEFASKISSTTSSLVCYCRDFVKILLPQPRLIRLLENSTIDLLEDELKSIEGNSELGVVELEYINVLIALKYLQQKDYKQGFDIWTSGIVDPRLLIYIAKHEVFGQIWLFNGLKPIVNKIRSDDINNLLTKETKFKNFFFEFLDKWIEKESYTENTDILRSIELANLRVSLNDDERVMKIVDRGVDVTLNETVDILKANGKYLALSKIYTKQGKYREVLNIHKNLVDGNKKDSTYYNKEDSLTMIIDLVYKHFGQDEDLVWDIGLWLIKKNPELGLNFFQNEGLNIKIKDETLLISKIEDITLKYKYVEKLLVRLNKEKMKSSLVKNLHKSELRSLNERIKVYKRQERP